MNLTHIPLRAATGAFILNSGLEKLGADEETAKGLHGMASTAYPAFAKYNPKDFTQALGAGEVALGAALLTPTLVLYFGRFILSWIFLAIAVVVLWCIHRI